MHLAVGAGSDVGMIRSGNEDSFMAEADERRGVFVVADGMGGHAAGEVASEMAVQIVGRHLLTIASVVEPTAQEKLAQALRDANRAIYDRMMAEVDKQGMGTTASVLALSDDRFLIGQIGPARILDQPGLRLRPTSEERGLGLLGGDPPFSDRCDRV